jgi:hypothetical protein
MPGPVEIVMRIASRFGYAIDGMDSESQLDAMIARAERHGDVGADRLAAHETSLPRTPFTAHIPFRQQAVSRMSWREMSRVCATRPA